MGHSSRVFEVSTEVVQLRQLTEVGRALTYTTTLDEVAQLTVDRGAELLEAPAAVLMLADADGLLHVRASRGVAPANVARFVAPVADDFTDRLHGLLQVDADRCIAVPLVVAGAVTGILGVSLSRVASASDEWLLSALADQTAVALEGARLGSEYRQEMETRLQASEGATHAKDRALATLAHDIRSPLGAIDGYCANLEDGLYGPVTERQRHALDRVRMSGRHLLSLLDSVMDMARLNAGILPVPQEHVDLAAVARETVDMLLPAAVARGQVLLVAGAGPGAGVLVHGHQARIRQVLVNLVGNAAKFTPEGGTITVDTRPRTIDGLSWGEVRVTDTGPGIAAAEQRAIFEPYYRSDDVLHTPGVGLGLAISRALIAQMHGFVELESAPGAGASFSIRLPAVSDRAATGA